MVSKYSLSERHSKLSLEKKLLLEKRLQGKLSNSSEFYFIRSHADRCLIPLSYSQERLWFLNQLYPSDFSYNIFRAFPIEGLLKLEFLEQGLSEIAHRHEILRTIFPLRDGRPIQFISTNSIIELPVVDLQRLPKNEQNQEIRRLSFREARQLFNLTQGPLWSTKILQITQRKYILLLTLCHIICDGLSIDLFMQELTKLYDAILFKKSPELPKLDVQYADFTLWQRKYLGEELDRQMEYWKQKLRGDIPVLKLPFAHPPSIIQTRKSMCQSLDLSKTLTKSLIVLSQRKNVTLFITILTVLNILLYRHSAQEDIIIGVPISNRNRVETEKLIGLFLNMLPLRTNLSGTQNFFDILTQVKKIVLEAYANQDVPFEKLVKELQIKRDLKRHPIFDVALNFFTGSQKDIELTEITIKKPLNLARRQAKFLMTFYISERDNKLVIELVYYQDFFSAKYIKDLLSQFKCLLEQVVINPNNFIKSYSLVTPKFRSVSNNPNVEIPASCHDTVTKLFIDWVNYMPENVAIHQGRYNWTYNELASKAHCLAQILIAQGVKPGDVIAVSGHRSFGLITSMLGIFLSRGVLLTLDQNLPHYRKQLILQESKARILLCVGKQNLKQTDLPTLYVDPINGENFGLKIDKIIALPELVPDDAAYIFFTSGTTGIPKGILGNHKSISHFLNWQRQTFTIGPQDRCAQLTGLSFDVVLRDIFLPLTSGATLCLPTEGDEPESTRILTWLERERISLLHTVPSLAQSWLTNVPSTVSLRHLRWIFFAGEPLQEKLIRQWRVTFPESGKLINLYGPTETTLAKCYFCVPVEVLPGIQPIGQPLPETQVLVLNEQNTLCGIGEIGEIVIRTPFRSLGYLNVIEEKRWRRNPFRKDEQDLLFYTGDLGRYRPDGSLDILGRLDSQVKIRGIRIEPEEIEVTINQYSSVHSSVVTVWGADEDKRLIAYLTLNPGCSQDLNELRLFLKQRLPDYMLPAHFFVLDSLPLTPHGKVDKRALPLPEQFERTSQETFTMPRNTLELQLVKIWETVLKIQPIGVHDNFFDLGGHSLLTVRLLNEIQKDFGKKDNITLIKLFQFPTVAQQAKILSEKSNIISFYTLEIIQYQGTYSPLFFLCPTKYVFSLTKTLGTSQPVYNLNSLGFLESHKKVSSLKMIVKQYIEEIKTIQPNGPYYLVGYCGQTNLTLETAKQLQAQGDKIAFLGLIHAIPYYPKWSLFDHWRKFKITGFSYIMKRIQSRLYKTIELLKNSPLSESLTKKIHNNTKQKLPQELEYEQFISSFREALNSYTPTPHVGDITLFYQSEKCLKLALEIELAQSVAAGKIEICEVPAKYDDDLFVSPQVEILGKQLKQRLEKAQASCN